LANLIALSMEVFDLERVQRYSRRLVEINPRSVPGLQGLTLVAVERGEMEVAARHFAALVEYAPDLRGTSDEDVMEYRVSRKAIDRIRECINSQPVKPAARRY
jgi:predicted secreted protein